MDLVVNIMTGNEQYSIINCKVNLFKNYLQYSFSLSNFFGILSKKMKTRVEFYCKEFIQKISLCRFFEQKFKGKYLKGFFKENS